MRYIRRVFDHLMHFASRRGFLVREQTDTSRSEQSLVFKKVKWLWRLLRVLSQPRGSDSGLLGTKRD